VVDIIQEEKQSMKAENFCSRKQHRKPEKLCTRESWRKPEKIWTGYGRTKSAEPCARRKNEIQKISSSGDQKNPSDQQNEEQTAKRKLQ
jgi:hypothetical protein